MKIVLFNGPPSSGKDTAAKHLYPIHKDHHNIVDAVFERFSMPLKTAFAAMTNTPINDYYENEVYEPIKEKMIMWLGVSYRQWQIDFSESFMKPKYGNDIFGRLFVARLETYNPHAIIFVPDSGFDIEIEVLEKNCDPKDVILCRCHRNGCDFSRDSRSYVYSEKFLNIDLTNNGTKKDFENKCESLVHNWLMYPASITNKGW